MQTIVISGATGFLGSHLVRRFAGDGHRVLALVRNHSSRRRLADQSDRIQFGNTDEVPLETLLHGVAPIDAVVHTATDYGRRGSTPSELVATNVLWGLQLAEAASKAQAACFINTGTALAPEVSPYALSKSQFSQWGNWLADNHKLRFIDVRLEHMYGEDDAMTKFATYVIVNCLCNVERLPLTAGEQQRDFVYIDDVVAAFVRLSETFAQRTAETAGGCFLEFDVGSGKTVRICELARLIAAMTATRTILDFGVLPYRPNEVMYSQADLRAINALGWSPQYSLDEGLARTVAWSKAHWKEIETCVG